jgi:hypothetical protein
MGRHAGLTKKTITAKGKHGPVKRSYWVRASGAVKGAARKAGKLAQKHKGAIKTGAKVAGAVLAAAALAKGAHHAVKHRGEITGKVAGRLGGAIASWKTTGAINRAAGAAGANDLKMGVGKRLKIAREDARSAANIGGRIGQAADVVRQDRRDPNVGKGRSWRNVLSRDNKRPNVGG